MEEIYMPNEWSEVPFSKSSASLYTSKNTSWRVLAEIHVNMWVVPRSKLSN